MDNNLYSEYILEHARSPLHYGILTESNHVLKVANLSCGDDITLYLDVSDKIIRNISFISSGCALSMAGASLTADYLFGKEVSQLKTLTPGDIYGLLGVPITPARSACLLLCYSAFEKFLKEEGRDIVNTNG